MSFEVRYTHTLAIITSLRFLNYAMTSSWSKNYEGKIVGQLAAALVHAGFSEEDIFSILKKNIPLILPVELTNHPQYQINQNEVLASYYLERYKITKNNRDLQEGINFIEALPDENYEKPFFYAKLYNAEIAGYNVKAEDQLKKYHEILNIDSDLKQFDISFLNKVLQDPREDIIHDNSMSIEDIVSQFDGNFHGVERQKIYISSLIHILNSYHYDSEVKGVDSIEAQLTIDNAEAIGFSIPLSLFEKLNIPDPITKLTMWYGRSRNSLESTYEETLKLINNLFDYLYFLEKDEASPMNLACYVLSVKALGELLLWYHPKNAGHCLLTKIVKKSKELNEQKSTVDEAYKNYYFKHIVEKERLTNFDLRIQEETLRYIMTVKNISPIYFQEVISHLVRGGYLEADTIRLFQLCFKLNITQMELITAIQRIYFTLKLPPEVCVIEHVLKYFNSGKYDFLLYLDKRVKELIKKPFLELKNLERTNALSNIETSDQELDYYCAKAGESQFEATNNYSFAKFKRQIKFSSFVKIDSQVVESYFSACLKHNTLIADDIEKIKEKILQGKWPLEINQYSRYVASGMPKSTHFSPFSKNRLGLLLKIIFYWQIEIRDDDLKNEIHNSKIFTWTNVRKICNKFELEKRYLKDENLIKYGNKLNCFLRESGLVNLSSSYLIGDENKKFEFPDPNVIRDKIMQTKGSNPNYKDPALRWLKNLCDDLSIPLLLNNRNSLIFIAVEAWLKELHGYYDYLKLVATPAGQEKLKNEVRLEYISFSRNIISAFRFADSVGNCLVSRNIARTEDCVNIALNPMAFNFNIYDKGIVSGFITMALGLLDNDIPIVLSSTVYINGRKKAVANDITKIIMQEFSTNIGAIWHYIGAHPADKNTYKAPFSAAVGHSIKTLVALRHTNLDDDDQTLIKSTHNDFGDFANEPFKTHAKVVCCSLFNNKLESNRARSFTLQS